jgi:hypothetical protein
VKGTFESLFGLLACFRSNARKHHSSEIAGCYLYHVGHILLYATSWDHDGSNLHCICEAKSVVSLIKDAASERS